MESPRVSIIIPCYNYAHTLSETLDCLLAQDFHRWEAIVINDGSTDNTETVVKQYVNLDKRFSGVSQVNKGLPAARNAGIARARGEFILPLDADDLISKSYLSEAVLAMEESPEIGIVYSQAELFGAIKGKWKLPAFTLRNMLAENIVFCTGLFRKEDWVKVGGYKEDMLYGLEDWEFWLSLLELGVKVVQLQNVHFFYRVHKRSMARTVTNKFRSRAYDQVFQYHQKFIFMNTPNHLELYREHQEMLVVRKFLGPFYKYILRIASAYGRS